MFEISEQDNAKMQMGAKIKVIGVGGGGCNAVNTMIKAGLSGVEYVVANTDSQALNVNLAETKVQLGVEITKGLGAGANPEIGRKAALDDYEKLSNVLEGADMVFITAGMGGGTGTGAAPVIAKLCKEMGALAVGVVTKPFAFEGKKRLRQALFGIENLEESVDSLITIPNQRLLAMAGDNLSLIDTFKKADEVLLNAVRGISDLINTTGYINADFADVSTVMANKGLSLMGSGMANGPDRAIKAANEAISSPLLEDISIDGATGIIINLSGNESLTMYEVNEAVTLIMEAADEEAEIIYGTVIDDSLEDNIKITVIATGLGGQERVKAVTSMPAPREKKPLSSGMPMDQGGQTISNISSDVQYEAQTNSAIMDNIQDTASYSSPEVSTTTVSSEESSPLMQSIKNAANKYSEKKSASPARSANINENTSESSMSGIRKNPSEGGQLNLNRAKSIAEKLGIIGFDEEELDRPTYLRNTEGQSLNNNMDI